MSSLDPYYENDNFEETMIRLQLTEGGNTKPFEKELETEMDKEVKHFERELSKLRTGRAHTSMVEDIKIMAYGTFMSLRELASITVPDPSLIIVQPWDKSLLADIEKALATSELGVSPVNDGNVIRVPIPRMSKERRDELIKLLHKKLEECKVAIRNTRKEFQNFIRDIEKEKKISEDYARRLSDILQKTTDRFIEMAEKIGRKKEEEIATQ